ncbi:hypothetical protein [uncultured Enterovirga sp.]|uniref:hypothetical protein n=1 Tax=uncultured Enterovirga sp. TaxID=2026352 RepID=UPI0035C94C81
MEATQLPLSWFIPLVGAGISEDGTSIRFDGARSGIALHGPYLPVDAGLHTFLIDVTFPTTLRRPQVVFEIFGDGSVLSTQKVEGRCTGIRISAYVPRACPIELRVLSDNTPFDITRVMHVSGIAGRDDVTRRDRVRGQLAALFRPDLVPDSPSRWMDVRTATEDILRDNALTVISLPDLDASESLLRHVGAHPAAIKALFARNNQPSPGACPEQGSLVDGHPVLPNKFQEEILRHGFLTIDSPYTGRPIQTQSSIPLVMGIGAVSVFYEFLEERPVVVSTGWAGQVSFIWLVEDDILVSEVSPFWWQPEQAVPVLVSFIIANAEKLFRYRRRDHKLALVSGFLDNMGHYFWHETSGLERMIRSESLGAVDRIYVPRTRWMSPQDIFGREGMPPMIEARGEDLAGYTLEHNLLVVRPTGTKMDDGLAHRIRRAADKLFVERNATRHAAAEELTSAGKFILFVNLRAHNRGWKEQEEGIIACIRKMRELCAKEMIVFFDGFFDCEPIAKRIAAADVPGVQYVDGLAGSAASIEFHETVYWAFRSDFFLTTIGSGLVFPTWIASKPGICYGNAFHRIQLNFWEKVRPGMAKIWYPANDQFVDDGPSPADNFSLAPSVLVDLLSAAWTELVPPVADSPEAERHSPRHPASAKRT